VRSAAAIVRLQASATAVSVKDTFSGDLPRDSLLIDVVDAPGSTIPLVGDWGEAYAQPGAALRGHGHTIFSPGLSALAIVSCRPFASFPPCHPSLSSIQNCFGDNPKHRESLMWHNFSVPAPCPFLSFPIAAWGLSNSFRRSGSRSDLQEAS
jgi:hypothetical protein